MLDGKWTSSLLWAATSCQRLQTRTKPHKPFNVELTVQVSTKLNRSHLITGKEALILPCLGRTEVDEQPTGRQFVTVENSMGQVHRSIGGLAPASTDLR